MARETQSRRSRGGSPRLAPVRFAAMLRVDYPAGGRTTFAYTAQLSVADMVLRARNLPAGESLPFQLALSKTEVLSLKGRVGEPDGDGVRVTFEEGQDEAAAAIRAFLVSHHVKELQEAVARSTRFPDRALQLAAWYRESGQDSEALELLRFYFEANPKHLGLAEATAEAMLESTLSGQSTSSADALEALAAVVDHGQSLGGSESLTRMAKALAEARKDFERRKDEDARKAAEAERKVQEEKVSRLREKLLAEAEADARKAF
ncbi:MAG: hypothetical protein HY901_29815 [Deltaproteobacteria bacterium]|nr:hypothetical protein [Deltaproteobacteria bacterium]